MPVAGREGRGYLSGESLDSFIALNQPSTTEIPTDQTLRKWSHLNFIITRIMPYPEYISMIETFLY